jgi:glycosyltransferase involved in cell wall biosynthesis
MAGLYDALGRALDAAGVPGTLHRNPSGARGIRWRAMFGSPFFHPTVLLDRERVDRAQLRYDPSYAESEDYELWARLLSARHGANLAEPLVLKRVHPGQASLRRGALQESFQREVAMREIGRIAPDLTTEQAELAWGLGSGRKITGTAVAAYIAVLRVFEDHHGVDAEVRASAVRVLLAAGARRRALEFGVSQSARLALRGARRRVDARRARDRAATWLTSLDKPPDAIRVAVVSPEPTPYRSPLFDRVASRPEVDLTVIYAAETVADRTWSVDPEHRAEFLRGRRLPGVHGVLRHDYPVTPGIGRALARVGPDVVVISGWSTFPSQAAIAWSRAHGIPYVLLVESHDLGPRAWWRRAVKGLVVPRLMRKAANVLVVGTAARESVVARGARPDGVRIFANTVDVELWGERAGRLQAKRDELRVRAGLTPEDVVVLSVARLVPEKGLHTLIRAAAATGDERIRVVVAGSGPASQQLTELAESVGIALTLLGDLPQEALAEAYVRADVFALLSMHETWGVVVNEAAASGLPLLLSDRVGAAQDQLDVELLEIARAFVAQLVGGRERKQRHVPSVSLGIDHAFDQARRLVLALQPDRLDTSCLHEGIVEGLLEARGIGPARITDEDALLLRRSLLPKGGHQHYYCSAGKNRPACQIELAQTRALRPLCHVRLPFDPMLGQCARCGAGTATSARLTASLTWR